MRHFRPLVTLLGLLVATGTSSEAGEAPWSMISAARENLAASAQQATFVQHYQPSGFATTDLESGQLFFSIPECVRWDYDPPDIKSFLLCDDTLYAWAAGDPAGRRFHVDDQNEPGIDLLRLRLDKLEQRYQATQQATAAGLITIVLAPRDSGNPIREARMTIDPAGNHLVELYYEDREGNRSRFEIEDYRPLSGADRFQPPAGLEWLDQ